MRSGQRRLVLALCCALGASAFIAHPASASNLEIVDPTGDATGVHFVESSPRPNDPELDIVSAQWTTTADSLIIRVKLATMAVPALATGWAHRYYFTYEGVGYHFLVEHLGPPMDSAGFDDGMVFYGPGTTLRTCAKCSFKFDPKAKTVTVTAAISSLASAAKAASPDAPPFKKGVVITNLYVLTQREEVILTLGTDWARAKPDYEFTV